MKGKGNGLIETRRGLVVWKHARTEARIRITIPAVCTCAQYGGASKRIKRIKIVTEKYQAIGKGRLRF